MTDEKRNAIKELAKDIENANYCLSEECPKYYLCQAYECPIDEVAEGILINWLNKIAE